MNLDRVTLIGVRIDENACESLVLTVDGERYGIVCMPENLMQRDRSLYDSLVTTLGEQIRLTREKRFDGYDITVTRSFNGEKQ